jgi:hypothetical protein
MRYTAAKGGTLRHASGRNYAIAAGGTVDVPDTEAEQIDHVSAGAVRLGRSGPTGQRPIPQGNAVAGLGALPAGTVYLDTTLGKPVFWTGAGWVDMTGTAA